MQFKNGSCKIVDKESGVSFIKRYGDRQSELSEGTKDSLTFIVNWIDDCTYTLKPTKEDWRAFTICVIDNLIDGDSTKSYAKNHLEEIVEKLRSDSQTK